MSSFAGMDEPYSRYASANKNKQGWEDDELNTIPRSPLAFDQQQSATLPRQRRGTASLGLESNSRQSKATPTLSSLQTSRPYPGGRHSGERGVSVALSQHRSPYPSSSQFFLTVIPPVDLPHDPPHPRSQASTSSSSHIRRGTLLPLCPTLGGQLYAISREYGLPSIGGLSIYLCDDGEGNLGPRVGDAAWSALWNRFFDESADDIYQDITSPHPMQRAAGDRDRHFSGTSSSEVQSPFVEQSSGLRRERDSYDDGYLNDQRRPSSSLRKTFTNGYPASPMAYNTPSPRHPKGRQSDSRLSQRAASASTQARLPIVGRIEWAVDKNRAPWWSNWIGEADVSSERSVSNSIFLNQTAPGSVRKGPARRSMHLTPSLARSRGESPTRGTPMKADQVKSRSTQQDEIANEKNRGHGATEETISGTEDRVTSVISSPQDSNLDLQGMGYEPIEDQEPQQIRSEEQSFDDGVKVNGMPGHSHSDAEASYDNQSYAGYSVLLGVDEETRARDGVSSGAGKEEQSFQTLPLRLASAASHIKEVKSTPRRVDHHFNANILTESDDDQWGGMQEDDEGRGRDMLPDRLSARSLSEQKELSAVHEWIAKTQSPQTTRRAELDLEDEGEEEELLPPQDDIGEVLGLWAEKAREVHTIASPTVIQSNRSSLASTSKTGLNPLATSQKNSGLISSASSRRSASASPRTKQSPLLHGVARLADLPEEMPSTTLQGQSAFNKISLLSPIALDNSPAIFAGPSAKLGNLLGTTRSTLGPNDEQTYSYTRQSTADSLTMPEGEASVNSRNTLSSPRLELPSPRSPGAFSLGSSSTEASDTLLDMERALALLSPAANQESPAMGTSTADSTYDSGVLTSAVRVKMPLVSSKESMAKAKTLSTSVTPSPRWFRNTTPALPRLAQSTSEQQISGSELPVNQGYETAALRISPRPASASASTKNQDRLTAWSYPAPESAARLVEKVADEDQSADEMKKKAPALGNAIEHTEEEVQDDKEVAEENKSEMVGEGARVTASDLTVDPVTVSSPATSAGRTILSSVAQRDSAQIYDSPIEDFGRESHHWLQPGEHFSRQGWSETTGETSRVLTMGDSMLPEGEGTDQADYNPSDLPSGPRSPPAISAAFSPRSGQYATVGVQAERDDLSRTNSLVSLVSDEALGSEAEASQLMQRQEKEGEGEEEKEQDQEKNVPKKDILQTPVIDAGLTPQLGGQPRFGHSGNSSIDIQPSIQRLIRGNSFAESSEASSTNANSPYVEGQVPLQGRTMQDFDWSRFDIDPTKPKSEAEDVTIQQQGIEEAKEEDTMVQGGAHTNESSFEGEDWSQSGSEYEDDGSTGSPATKASRLSDYSHRNATGVSDAGGRTPTFFYDSHLTDDEPASRRASRRMSSNRRSSANRKSLRLSRAPVRSLEVQDALGVGLLPTGQATISPGPEHRREGLSVRGSSAGETSIDSNRHDVISLAGETLEGYDGSMLTGFEQVSPPPNVVQGGTDQNNSSNQSARMQALSDYAFSASPGKQVDAPSTPLDKTIPEFRSIASAASPRSNGKTIGASLRRSMGSIHEDRREDLGQGRRASASATSPGKTAAIHNGSLQSPRRFKGAMLRLGGLASPNQRFRALPPSPNLPPKTMNGLGGPLSPIDNSFVNSMVSPQTTFSSMDSLTLNDGITGSESVDRVSPSPLSY